MKMKKKTLNCYYENEDGEKISKGLFIIAQDLGLIRRRCLPKEYKLEQLRAMLKEHPAFKEETKLEELSKKYPIIKIIFMPKFHCELSPIEGVWAFEKNYVRRNNDQTSLKNFLNLLETVREIIKEHVLCRKLWRRFWHTVEAYHEGKPCEEIMKKYFGYRCISNIKQHRQVVNSNL